ncbi:MAG: hypothetical protein ACKVQV_06675 [Bacteroidia bacterium]
MSVNYPPTGVKNLIHDMMVRITFAMELGQSAGVKQDLLNLYNEVEGELIKLKSTIELNNFSTEYTNQLAKALEKLTHAFPRSYGSGNRVPIALQDIEVPLFKNQQERDQPIIEEALNRFKTTFNFFLNSTFLTGTSLSWVQMGVARHFLQLT